MRKVLNLMLVKTLEYQNIKIFFAKGDVRNWSEDVFVIKKKLKILFLGHVLLVILKAKKLLEHFMEKNYKYQNKKNLGLKK